MLYVFTDEMSATLMLERWQRDLTHPVLVEMDLDDGSWVATRPETRVEDGCLIILPTNLDELRYAPRAGE